MLRVRAFAYLLATDCLAIFFGFGLVAIFREEGAERARFLAPLIPVYVAVALSSHGYASSNLQDPFRAISKATQAFAIAVGAVILGAFYLQTSSALQRLTLGMGSLLTLGLLVAGRYLVVRNLAELVGGNPFSVVLICDGDTVVPDGVTTVMYAADHGFDPLVQDPVMYDRLAIALESADRVVVTCPPERRVAWVNLLKGANVRSEVVVPELADLAPLDVGHHGGEPTLVVGNGPLGLIDRAIKRGFDLVVASVALVLLSPLMLGVAAAIALESGGPILFRQMRIGRGNQLFRLLKFRSMHAVDEAGARSTSRDDDRVTRIGRFIRRTSIDELPQLFNVLAGSMSIVGPRPHALGSRAESKLFWDIDGRYWHRHAIKPGLTGLAQVRGYRGATIVEDDLRNRLQADLEYLENWSILRDVKIIALTARVLLHRNAF